MTLYKATIVKQIIDKLRTDTTTTDEFIQRDAQCVKELSDLSQEYSQVIFEYAQNLLDNLKIDDEGGEEYYFQVLVESLLFRKDKAMEGDREFAFLLASQALMSPNAEDNNRYVSFLIDTAHLDVIPMLIKGLEIMESFDDLGGHAQEKALEYLMEKEVVEAYPVVMEKCLFDVSDRVRATALQFIDKFDKQESAPQLLELLEKEDVEYNILLILKLLKKWNFTEALPQLEKYLQEDWVYDDPDLLTPFEQTIQSLEE